MILVTGGTGFVGSYLIDYLLNQGKEVRVLVRNPQKLKFDVDFVVGDITDRETLKTALRSVEEVYHLAAVFRHGVDPSYVWRVNYHGTRNVVDECFRRNVRLLHVSTVGVLGHANSKPLNENSPYRPNPNPYSQSKAKAEQYVLEMCKKGLNAVIVRPAFVYGIGSRYGLNLLMDLVIKRKLKVVIGKGENCIHPVHVKDLVRAMVLIMTKAKSGEVYIVANEEPVKLRYFLDLVARCAGVKLYYGLPPKLAYLILKLRGGIGGSSAKETILLFTKNWFYSIEKLKSLGWKQEVNLEEGVKETVNWLKST